MQGTLEEVRRLLADGYSLVDVASDRGCIEAAFLRGASRVTVKIPPHEAEALLLLPRGRLYEPSLD